MFQIPLISQEHLGRRGVFYVGGQMSGQEGKHHYARQMFVEVYEPKVIRHPYPIIMMHGAGQTNVNWQNTPDGRMGWCDYFVSQGYTVYLTEQPARARSAYHPEENGPTIYHSVEALLARFITNHGTWPQAKLHDQWPGNPENADDEALKQFLRSQVEYLPSNKDSQALVLEAGRELLELTGPAILLTHSQAGPFGWLLRDACPEKVMGIVALEPSGPPFTNDPANPQAKNFGIADLPLHFDPPVKSPADLKLQHVDAPEEGQNPGWILQEPAPQLVNLKGTPILFLVSESSYHRGYDYLTSRTLTQCGVEHDFVPLASVGIHGNGHMMMLEKNNLEIADFILSWLKNRNL